MADLMLQSKANGTWEYEILEGKTKVKYKIKKGFNEIPESHVETLEDDPGYNGKIRRGVYKVLKGSKAKAAEKSDEKSLDKAREVNEVKALYKDKISDLKKEHTDQLKKDKEDFNSKIQSLTELRKEALDKVKILEAAKLTFDGEMAQLKAGANKDAEILKTEFKDLETEKDKLEKDSAAELSKLKTDSQKAIKALEGEKASLEKKVKDQKAELKAK
jgi:hypothetical protein